MIGFHFLVWLLSNRNEVRPWWLKNGGNSPEWGKNMAMLELQMHGRAGRP
jgi:hypothetical protein